MNPTDRIVWGTHAEPVTPWLNFDGPDPDFVPVVRLTQAHVPGENGLTKCGLRIPDKIYPAGRDDRPCRRCTRLTTPRFWW